MRIDRNEVRRIAALASLEFDPEHETAMSEQMSHILDYIDQLGEVDVATTPDATVAAAHPLREDTPQRSLPVDEVASNAPRFVHGFFVVPRIIGGD